MTTDYANKEREFLQSLKADTGRDLDEWMAEIAAQNLPHRNDVIDWLRHQGFIFSWASWLERIYHNDGQPIYLDAVPPGVSHEERPKPELRLVHSASTPEAPPPVLKPDPQPPTSETTLAPASAARPVTPLDPELQTVLAKGKAYAPLAIHVVKRIQSSIPDVQLRPQRLHVEIANPHVFAILLVAAAGLRLALNLGDHPIEPPLEKARAPNPTIRLPDTMAHMLTLTDARDVNSTFDAMIKKANGCVNG